MSDSPPGGGRSPSIDRGSVRPRASTIRHPNPHSYSSTLPNKRRKDATGKRRPFFCSTRSGGKLGLGDSGRLVLACRHELGVRYERTGCSSGLNIATGATRHASRPVTPKVEIPSSTICLTKHRLRLLAILVLPWIALTATASSAHGRWGRPTARTSRHRSSATRPTPSAGHAHRPRGVAGGARSKPTRTADLPASTGSCWTTAVAGRARPAAATAACAPAPASWTTRSGGGLRARVVDAPVTLTHAYLYAGRSRRRRQREKLTYRRRVPAERAIQILAQRHGTPTQGDRGIAPRTRQRAGAQKP